MTLEDIMTGSKYNMERFSEDNKNTLLARAMTKSVKGKEALYVKCPVRQKDIKLTPEEIVRQLYLDELQNTYAYPLSRIQVEYVVNIGREKKRADYLTLLLNSFVVAMQAERDVGGSIIKHWRLDEINKIVLPILNEQLQSEIAAKVRQSFALREESKKLLKAAARAVEIAIEQDEAAAMAYLQEQ